MNRIKRVYIIGPSAVGKTTIIDRLKKTKYSDLVQDDMTIDLLTKIDFNDPNAVKRLYDLNLSSYLDQIKKYDKLIGDNHFISSVLYDWANQLIPKSLNNDLIGLDLDSTAFIILSDSMESINSKLHKRARRAEINGSVQSVMLKEYNTRFYSLLKELIEVHNIRQDQLYYVPYMDKKSTTENVIEILDKIWEEKEV